MRNLRLKTARAAGAAAFQPPSAPGGWKTAPPPVNVLRTRRWTSDDVQALPVRNQPADLFRNPGRQKKVSFRQEVHEGASSGSA